jgi:aryl-alcohol dehydrogenase-like predicted oxidoreductase
MRYETLGRTPLTVPALILGCGNFGGIGSPPELIGRGDDEPTAVALMDRAVDLGITMFDTSNSYAGGRSEEWIGRWMASRKVRDRITVTTKVRHPVGPAGRDEGLSRRHIHEQVDASLRRLGTDRIELYLAHAPDEGTPIEETVGAFDDLVRAGKILHYGLSNFDADQLEDAAAAAVRLGAAPPVNLQNEYNLFDRGRAGQAFEVCSRYGVGFTAFSPLAGGWLTGKYRAGRPFPEGSRMALRPGGYERLVNEATFAGLAGLDRAASARGLSLPTLALAWVLTDPHVTALLVGARTPAQLTDACAALDVPLTAAERAEIAAVAG